MQGESPGFIRRGVRQADIQRIDSLNVGSAKDASENNELTPKQKTLVKKLLKTLEKMEKNKAQKTGKTEIER